GIEATVRLRALQTDPGHTPRLQTGGRSARNVARRVVAQVVGAAYRTWRTGSASHRPATAVRRRPADPADEAGRQRNADAIVVDVASLTDGTSPTFDHSSTAIRCLTADLAIKTRRRRNARLR